MRVILNIFKLSLFVFNTLYFLIGLGLVIGSTFVYLNPNQLNSLIKLEYGQEYAQVVYGLNAAGIFLILVGFFGSMGVLSEKSCLIFIYFCCLFGIFTLQFTCSIYIYTQSRDFFKLLSIRVLRVIREEYGESGVHARALDYLQAEFNCCGWYSPRDWFMSSYVDPKYTLRAQPHDISNVITISPAYLYKIPHSCCANTYDLTCLLLNKFHEVGCEPVVKYIYQTTELYVAWSLAFLNMYQLVILILTLYLLCIVFYDQKSVHDEEASSYKIDNYYRKFNTKSCVKKYFCCFCYYPDAGENSEDGEYEQNDEFNGYRDRDQVYMTSYYL